MYFIAMVQYSAILVPFWDHCELIPYFAKLYDGTLRVSDLWASHNHTRPFTYRTLLLASGWLTDWDLRSEYIYVIASVLGAFMLLARALRRVTGELRSTPALVALGCLSLFAFSPVGHNNHWWSMMLQLNLAHLLIVAALVTLANAPMSWRGHLLAALWCWLATYTISNGLLAFAACGFMAQLATRSWRPRAMTWFWIANVAIVATLYFPGLREATAQTRPTLAAWLAFTFIYLGAPLVGLVRYPFTHLFDVTYTVRTDVAVGGLLVLAYAYGTWRLYRSRDTHSRITLLIAGLGVFAIGSGIVTGWGRAAFDENGIAAATSSRYTIYSSYLIYALILLSAGLATGTISVSPPTRHRRLLRALASVGVMSLIVFAARSYASATRIYTEAYELNRALESAYALYKPDARMYPNGIVMQGFLNDLGRLQIGPYRAGLRVPTELRQLASNERVDEFDVNTIRQDPLVGAYLFAHPRSTFELPVEAGRHELGLSFGILDGAVDLEPPTDGVEFRVASEDAGSTRVVLWSHTLRPTTRLEDRGVQEARVTFEIAGPARLLFETAPAGRTDNAWAYWKRVRLESAVRRTREGTF